MSISDLSTVFGYFGYGLIIGGLFSGITFMTGYFINSIFEMMK